MVLDLVCQYLDPSWTQLFRLSHAGIRKRAHRAGTAPERQRRACKVLFKRHLFVVEALTVQHFHGDVKKTSEHPISRRTLRKERAQRFASFLHRQILGRRLTRRSVEWAGLSVREEYRFGRNTKLCLHASAFLDDMNRKMGPGQRKFRRSAAEELKRNSNRLCVTSMHQFIDDAEGRRVD